MAGLFRLRSAPDASPPAPFHRAPHPRSAPLLAWAHWSRQPAELAAAAAELASEHEAVSWTAAAAAAAELVTLEQKRALDDGCIGAVAAAELGSLIQMVNPADSAATEVAAAGRERWVSPRAGQWTAGHAAAAVAAVYPMVMGETAAGASSCPWTCLVCRPGDYRRAQ